MILFALAAAAWHWLLQDIVPVYQIKGISKLVKLCLPKVQCFCDSLTSPPSERQVIPLLWARLQAFKTRIGGFRELECFPCTAHTPRTESQCYPKSGPGQPTSTTPSPRDPVLLVAIIMVALSLILVTLVTFSVICCGRFLKRQFHRVFRRSQDFVGQPGQLDEGRGECAHCPSEQQIPPCCFGTTGISGQVQGQLEEVNVISKINTSNSCTVATALCSLPPSMEIYAIPSPPVKSHYSRSVSETQPLIRNSGCSDCFSGCGASAESNQGVVEPPPAQTHSCASEKQHWSHAPVECTELDLENFSSEDPSQAHSRISESHQTCSCPTPAASGTGKCQIS
ncbi:unnamed protein product [Ranitomeya imitator]|uniref:Tumor necrosis factor receptor superfamily member 27 n=1 Tax=Ranitomeya imitator TaxID=111125 RepID=A0ABN9LXK8_9NEOB|nr:unnamed protein product [Ranitomeya imitator]